MCRFRHVEPVSVERLSGRGLFVHGERVEAAPQRATEPAVLVLR
ncbi:hypothetical protein SAMN04488085_104162 [Geodermatophilus ruber]|uniref:Uncharacterized protein n=1 Tax=Geodermatophilus ruber TaxID=504800 RepID=A0A1I4D6E0_9ACTN|nr:hypothetical protein SAMN04488085_104162 [Geodermatophilus ruber]